MRYEILNRTELNNIPFREAMLELLGTSGDKLILGYGYLNPDIIDDEFSAKLKEGFANVNKPEIIIIGKNGENNDIFNYMKMTDRIKDILGKGNVRLFISKQDNYHKKEAVKLSNNRILIAILGSSNLSKRTFSKNTSSGNNVKVYFNQELDILFWSAWNLKRKSKQYTTQAMCKAAMKNLREDIIDYFKNINRSDDDNYVMDVFVNDEDIEVVIKDRAIVRYFESLGDTNSGKQIYNNIQENIQILKKCDLYRIIGDFESDFNIDFSMEFKFDEIINEIDTNKDLEEISLVITSRMENMIFNYFNDWKSNASDQKNIEYYNKFEDKFRDMFKAGNSIVKAVEEMNILSEVSGYNVIKTINFNCQRDRRDTIRQTLGII